MAAVNPTSVARPFTVRYAINTNGDIALAANTLLTCQPGTVETQTLTACANAQTGSPGDDNYFDMAYATSTSMPATSNSSSANAQRAGGRHGPLRGSLLGRRARPGRDAAAAVRPAPAAHRRRRPQPGRGRLGAAAGCPGGGGYVPVSASVLDTYTEDLVCPAAGVEERTRYQAFADVTALVKLGGGGTYTVANVQAGTGADRHAGWSLVVAYQDSASPRAT